MTQPSFSKRGRSGTPLGALVLGTLLSAHSAAAQDLRYTIAPTAQQVRWDDALGLDDTFTYGARAGIVFGRIVELQGFYLTSQGTDARIRDLYSRLNVNGTPPQNPGLDVKNYGADFVLNFGTGGITPYVRGGGSILRFEPDNGRRTDRIALQYAGGLRFGRPGGLRFNVYAQDLRFRIDRTLLLNLANPMTTGGLAAIDSQATKLRSNLAYGASVSIPLGSTVGYNDQPTSSLTNFSLPLDVFAGRLDFDGETGIGKQYLVGARTGVDFGPLVGLRGFYWRGVNSDFDATQRVQAYGGEGQFSLNTGAGLSPYLLAGAAQIDFMDGYRGPNDSATTARPRDRMALIGGAGVRIPIFSHLILNVAARDYLMSREGRLQDVNETGQLRSNWQYSAGLSLQLGGRTRSARGVRTDTVFVDRQSGQRMTPVGTRPTTVAPSPTTVAQTRVDTVVVTQRGDTLRGAQADSALGADRSLERRVVVQRVTTGANGQGYASDRTTQIVVPTEGEIIIRYGPPRPAAPAPGERRPDDMRRDEPRRDEVRRDVETRDVTRERIVERDLAAGGRSSGMSGVSAAELRDVVRQAVRDEMEGMRANALASDMRPSVQPPRGGAPAPRTSRSQLPARKDADTSPAMTEADLAAMERRIVERVLERLDARIDERVAAGLRDRAPQTPSARSLSADEIRTIVRDEVERARPAAPAAPAVETPRETTRASTQTRGGGVAGATVYSGFTFSNGFQPLLGARLDLGEVSPSLPGFHLVPELAFGFGGGGTSTYVAGNLLYEFGGVRLGPLGRVRPRASLGAGFINFGGRVGGRDGLDIVLTPAYGVTTDLPAIGGVLRALSAAGRTPELLVEHQGIDFFDVNRLVIGLTYRR